MAEEISATRRDAIKVGLGALAALGYSALAPSTALATVGNLQYGATNDAGTDYTRLDSSSLAHTLIMYNTVSGGSVLYCGQAGGGSFWCARFDHSGSGHGIYSQQSGTGRALFAETTSASNANPAIEASSAGTQAPAILGKSSSVHSNARGLMGEMTNAGAGGWGVEAKSGGTGGGALWAQVTAAGTGRAIRGSMFGTGGCMEAIINNAANAAPAFVAQTNGTGYAIWAEGGKAQLYLKPAATAGAPTAGAHQIGELFVDSTGKLFSCTASGTPGAWTPVIGTSQATSNVPKVISDTNTDYILLVEQKGTGYALEAKGTQALRVEGALSLSRSGRSKIAKGKKSITITVPGGVPTSANVICTMQGPGATIRYAKRYSATKIKVQLSSKATSTCYVAWMVLG